MKLIPLTKGQSAIVDDADFNWLNQWKWCVANGYAVRGVRAANGKVTTIFMHRLIMNTPIGMETDHRDANRLNNSRANLRICTVSQNQMNRHKRNPNLSSGVRGVTWDKRSRKWTAYIKVNQKHKNLGSFIDLDSAIQARAAAEILYFGEFSVVNN